MIRMADGPGYEIPLKRRREGRTDYRERLELLKSGDCRAVVRVSNNHCRVQIVRYTAGGDSTVASASTDDLEEMGWDRHTGNLPAAYLTGILAGYRAIDEGVGAAVADLGGRSREEGGVHYAAVKGIRDAGLDLPADTGVFPDQERISGGHIDDSCVELFENVKERIAEEHGDA